MLIVHLDGLCYTKASAHFMIKVHFPAKQVKRRVSLLRSPRKLFHLPRDGKLMKSSDSWRGERRASSPRRSLNLNRFVSLYTKSSYSISLLIVFVETKMASNTTYTLSGKLPRCISWLFLRKSQQKISLGRKFGVEQPPDFEKILIQHQDASLIHWIFYPVNLFWNLIWFGALATKCRRISHFYPRNSCTIILARLRSIFTSRILNHRKAHVTYGVLVSPSCTHHP